MARTFLQQETQIRNTPAAEYLDNIAPSLAAYQTNPTNIQEDLNNLRSQVHNLLETVAVGNWYDDLNVPPTFEGGAQRGVNDLNTSLHNVQRKRVLVSVSNLVDVTVPALQNWKTLLIGELPANTTAAIGSVSTRGTVAATATAFGASNLDIVSGSSAIDPKNLCEIVDGSTRDLILSSGRTVYGLFQTESAVDGSTMTGTTPNRAQISFVRINATGDALEACPVGDIAGKVINYSSVERKALEDLNEQDFLRGAVIDAPASATVTRQVAYDNQGTAPVEVTTNSDLDLNSAGIYWAIRDLANADLFKIIEGSTGGTSELQVSAGVDAFNVNAVVNSFLNGSAFDTGAPGTTINVGVTANQIDAGGALTVTSGGAGDLNLAGALATNLTDSYRAGSTWSIATGVALSSASAEWSLFETNFGEVSLMNAINQAFASAVGPTRGVKTYANVTVNTNANLDVSLADGNLDAALPGLDLGTFTDHDVYLNGNLLRGGINAGANNDYYPGTAITAPAQLKFEFKVKAGDVLCVVPWNP